MQTGLWFLVSRTFLLLKYSYVSASGFPVYKYIIILSVTVLLLKYPAPNYLETRVAQKVPHHGWVPASHVTASNLWFPVKLSGCVKPPRARPGTLWNLVIGTQLLVTNIFNVILIRNSAFRESYSGRKSNDTIRCMFTSDIVSGALYIFFLCQFWISSACQIPRRPRCAKRERKTVSQF